MVETYLNQCKFELAMMGNAIAKQAQMLVTTPSKLAFGMANNIVELSSIVTRCISHWVSKPYKVDSRVIRPSYSRGQGK
jgi:hypothetical protein